MKAWYKVLVIFWVFFFFAKNNIYAYDLSSVEVLDLDGYANSLRGYIAESDFFESENITENILSGSVDMPKGIIAKILNLLFMEITNSFKSSVAILVILIIIGILQSMEIENNSSVTKISKFVCYISISCILINNYLDVINIFKGVCNKISIILQVASPFLMLVMIVKGGMTTSNFINPTLLFASSFIQFLITNIVIPFFNTAVCFVIVDSLNENMRFKKLANFFEKSAIWIIGVILTIFLGILSLETNITTSVDEVTIKAITTSVSNFIPVVGKFFSDSFETVMGATEVVGKTGGAIGIIAVISVILSPLIKIIGISVVYNLLCAISFAINVPKIYVEVIENFANIYKSISGILIAVATLYIISIAIMINIYSSL